MPLNSPFRVQNYHETCHHDHIIRIFTRFVSVALHKLYQLFPIRYPLLLIQLYVAAHRLMILK
jgi:hypothetical protein